MVATTALDAWSLHTSPSDSSARVLAQHRLNVHTAKVLTLGERAEDVFLISGAELSDAKTQLEIEGDLLEAIAP